MALNIYLLFLVACFALETVTQDGGYVAPKTIQYPFGDEAYNDDITQYRATEEVVYSIDRLAKIKDIYTFCPNMSINSDVAPYNDDFCKKCDIRTTIDQKGAVLECFNCTSHGFLTEASPIGKGKAKLQDIIFFTTYIEIVNYTKETFPTKM